MNLDLDTAAAEWLAAKEAEREAVERRRALEDHMLSLLGVLDTLDGTATTETDVGTKSKWSVGSGARSMAIWRKRLRQSMAWKIIWPSYFAGSRILT